MVEWVGKTDPVVRAEAVTRSTHLLHEREVELDFQGPVTMLAVKPSY
jgi:hypothetical protein